VNQNKGQPDLLTNQEKKNSLGLGGRKSSTGRGELEGRRRSPPELEEQISRIWFVTPGVESKRKRKKEDICEGGFGEEWNSWCY